MRLEERRAAKPESPSAARRRRRPDPAPASSRPRCARRAWPSDRVAARGQEGRESGAVVVLAQTGERGEGDRLRRRRPEREGAAARSAWTAHQACQDRNRREAEGAGRQWRASSGCHPAGPAERSVRRPSAQRQASSVATRRQFGSPDEVSRAKVHRSVTSVILSSAALDDRCRPCPSRRRDHLRDEAHRDMGGSRPSSSPR